MCILAEDANKFSNHGLAGGSAFDSSGQEHDDTIHDSRHSRATKILAHGCCAGLASKSNLLDPY